MSDNPTGTFEQEARELLDQLEQTLLDLEHDPASSDLIDGAFRALHTIKGSGSMFGFERVAAFVHHVETAFDGARKGDVALTPELIALTLSAQDFVRRLIETPDDADDAVGAALLEELQGLVGGAGAGDDRGAAPAAAAPERSGAWRIRFRLPADAMAMGTNPLLLVEELCSLGAATVIPQADDVPPLEAITPTDCYVGWDVVLSTEAPREAIEQVFLFVLDDMELQIEPIDADNADRLLGEILVERGAAGTEEIAAALARQHPLGELLVDDRTVTQGEVAAALGEQRHMRAEGRAPQAADSIRVPAERLDELMDRVGELVIAQSRLKQIAAASEDQQVKSIAEEVERLALELRDSTMGVRMVPFGSLFGRFRRLIHDLGRDLGKEIQLVTRGEETELDKTVIERLNDPLVHLVRNAVDHGLEDAKTRLASGKPAQGRITLSARHAGAEVLISIKDDGRGLDPARIRARAEENGLIAPDSGLSEAELYQLVFQPGFSTAPEVTSLSGRGVGMDVVKRTIENLRGSIDVSSTAGRGAEVTLRLPLTLAIIDGLLVRVGEGRYVIPLSAVEECVELPPEEETRSRGRSFLNIRDELVPFLRLRELFGAADEPDPYPKVVVVSSGEQRVGLVVDQVIGDHQTVIKSLSKLHADVKTFSGATILGDGTVALILEVAQLVERGQVREERLKEAV